MNLNLDQDGYLENLEDWSPEVADFLAQQDGIALNRSSLGSD